MATTTITIHYPGVSDRTIKLQSNQCLFEVFEEYCKSENIDPSKYELCHSGKILDLRQNINLSGLTNNSTLTIRSITQRRDQSAITVCIQFNGEKQIGEFTSDQSLWEIIGTLYPEKVLDCKSEISCLYLRKEVVGVDKLQETKLSTLGILSGKVAIKLNINDLNNHNTQKAGPSSEPQSNKLTKLTKEIDQKLSSYQNTISSKLEFLKKKLASKKKNGQNQNQSTSNVLQATSANLAYDIRDELVELNVNEYKVVLFSQDDKQRLTSSKEVSDDFFEITREDVRLMYGDLQAQKSNLEDRPLETQKLRDQRLSKEEKRYDFTIIRLSFPFDHLVLQAVFKPSDTIEELVNLVKQFVNVDDFYLYTAPPKKVLDNKSTFLKEKLVPAALIQFGGNQKAVIKDEFKQQISSFAFVVSYTCDLRNKLKSQSSSSEEQTKQVVTNQEAIDKARKDKEERLMKLLNMKK